MAQQVPYATQGPGLVVEPQAQQDKLEGYWYVVLWGVALVPFGGAWITVILSSVMYYLWKKNQPEKARTINRQGWMAFLAGLFLWGLIWFGLNALLRY